MEEGMYKRFLPWTLAIVALAAGCFTQPNLPTRPATTTSPADAAKEARQKAALAVFKRGGKLVFDTTKPGDPLLVAELPRFRDAGTVLDAVGPLTDLRELNVYQTPFTDAELHRLEGLAELHTVNLSATRVTDAGLQRLRSLPKLRALYLSDTEITDAGLEQLRGMANLHDLALSRSRVTDEGLVIIGNLRNLQKLTLGGEMITDRGLQHLRGLHNLHELGLYQTRVSASGIEELRVALPHLKILH
jgi:Leucine-rich repeat (LRR) protein